MQKRFSTSAVLVLVTGIIVNIAVFLLSFSSAPFFYPARAVTSTEQAKQQVDQYISGIRSDLKVKEIMEFSNHFYALVREKSTGINAFELLLDKKTGTIFYEPGPNMMWNRKYGMIGRMSNPAASMPLNAQNASQYAQKWLDRNIPGAETEEAETFYGYYTIDFSKNGQIVGMLSVNGYTGDVWYHSWHGEFMKMVEYE